MANKIHHSDLLLCLLIMAGCNSEHDINSEREPVLFAANTIVEVDGPEKPNPTDFALTIEEAAAFCRKNNLETRAAILVDLGLHSGKYRCFVVNLSTGDIQAKGLVTHGSGHTGLGVGERKYSNENGSYLSALGKYKIGIAYQGQFGLAYKLHGLEATNNHAYERAIVLHGHECVPDGEMNDMVCQSWGCPTVSPAFLLTLQKVIDKAQKPVLLWIYDSAAGN